MATEPTEEIVDQIPKPEEVLEMRRLLKDTSELIDRGEVERISIYIEHRDGDYMLRQSRGPQSRHEDAGRLLELAMLRLRYVQRDDVRLMIDGAE